MKTWTLRAAQQSLGRVAELAVREGPQQITQPSKPPVVVIALDQLQKLTPGKVEEFFDSAPPMDDLARCIEEATA